MVPVARAVKGMELTRKQANVGIWQRIGVAYLPYLSGRKVFGSTPNSTWWKINNNKAPIIELVRNSTMMLSYLP